MEYFLKYLICSFCFLLFYKIVLSKQKSFTFNRFYLLTGLIVPAIIPLISFKVSLDTPIIQEFAQVQNDFSVIPKPHISEKPQTNSSNISLILWSLYGFVCLVFLLRFLLNLNTILKNINRSEKKKVENLEWVLLENSSEVHSFWKYIFVNKEDFINNKIDTQIIFHEKIHIQKKHSLDIILVEICQILFWFNPALFFYRKYIQLNHEFEVDQEVIKHFDEKLKYQYLLIQPTNFTEKHLVHSFNYQQLKQRLIMINKKHNRTLAIIGKSLSFILLISCTIIFAEKVIAQKIDKIEKPILLASSDIMEEFYSIFNKIYDEAKKGNSYNFTADETNKMGDLYNKMTIDQKESLGLTLQPILNKKLLPNPITNEMFEDFKNPQKYGVWLNGKRTKNSELEKYKASDFADHFKSVLLKNAKDYGKYQYHLELYTPKQYEENKIEFESREENYILWYGEKIINDIKLLRNNAKIK